MSIDVRVFNRSFDTSVVGQLLNVFKTPAEIKPRLRSSNGEIRNRNERTATVPGEDILHIEQMIEHVLQVFEARTPYGSELSFPEVFDLRPLSTKRVVVKIRRIESAPFYFVADDVPVVDSDN